jgi:hypothetical protein
LNKEEALANLQTLTQTPKAPLSCAGIVGGIAVAGILVHRLKKRRDP